MTNLAAEALCETLWPTRCALCDAPGKVLCDSCARTLEVIDLWQCCPACHAPWGRIQCCACTPVIVGSEDAACSCVSALRFEGGAATLIRTYKDKDEQRIAPILATCIADVIYPSWKTWACAVTYVTSTKAARRKRGFDHTRRIAEELAGMLGLPCVKTLEEPRSADQRGLGRQARRSNMEGRFHVVEGPLPARVLLIDDVFTTGATLAAARCALEAAGCEVRMATVARA